MATVHTRKPGEAAELFGTFVAVSGEAAGLFGASVAVSGDAALVGPGEIVGTTRGSESVQQLSPTSS